MCNHPELFERRDAKSPIFLQPCVYKIPRLVFDYDVRFEKSLILQKYFIFTVAEYIAHFLLETLFDFCNSLNLSYEDLHKIFRGDIDHR